MTPSPRQASRRGPDAPSPVPGGFSLVELQVTLVVLAIGVMGFSAVLSVHSRQMSRAEAWCRTDTTYYVTSQSNRWMRQFGAPAELSTEAGRTAWIPPVTGERKYQVHLNSFTRNFGAAVMSAGVTCSKDKDSD